MDDTIEQQVQDLSDGTRDVKEKPVLDQDGDDQETPDTQPEESDSTAGVEGLQASELATLKKTTPRTEEQGRPLTALAP